MADAQSAARLRAEIEKTQDKGRQARLLGELGEIAEQSRSPTWQGLLWLDVAKMAAAVGETDRALDVLTEARALGGGATFATINYAERLSLLEPGISGTDEAKRRSEAYASAIEAQA